MKWTTFQGTEKMVNLADHQHLSNCIWNHVLLWGHSMHDCNAFVQEIERRFKNKILPYRPHPRNAIELSMLVQQDWVRWTDDGHCIIIVNRKVIGEILRPTHPLFHNRF